jgi:flagellar hook protein FlgE
MGLSSVFNTAITGLQAAETTIDVAGNNVANSNTIGFKQSEALFSTQFLQKLSLGSAPSESSGGTNPRQIGLGTQVAAIRPVFTQGTIAISSSPSDLALQGDGFFIVQSASGEQLYTRNGKFDLNSQNELVTAGGQRLLGYGVDNNFQIQPTSLTTLTIPIGAAAVAKPTENVYMQGTLSPTGDIADTGEIIQSRVFSDGSKGVPPDLASGSITALAPPSTATSIAAQSNSASGTLSGTYSYKVTFVDANGNEGPVSSEIGPTTLFGANDTISLSNLPSIPTGFSSARIYRAAGSGNYQQLATIASGSYTGSYTDDGTVAPSATTLNTSSLDIGSYSYYVTWYNSSTGLESRPTSVIGPQAVTTVGQKISLKNIPQPPTSEYDSVRIYRSLAGTSNSPGEQYRVATLTAGSSATTYIDGATDSTIQVAANKINLDGPPISAGMKVSDLVYRDGTSYVHLFNTGSTFTPGEFSFTGRKGDRALTEKSVHVDATTTVQQLSDFMDDSMGIQAISGSEGGSVTADSRLQFLSNAGVDNKIEIRLSGLNFKADDATTPTQLNMNFTSTQQAKGQSAVADFVAYDSLGIPVSVRITTVLESRTDTETTYRWFADSGDNDPASGSAIAVGTGEIKFNGEGQFLSSTNSAVAIARSNIPSLSPLEFTLDFNQISGLAAAKSSLSASRQDGFPPGKLTSYLIGEDGKIRGVFDNGTERDLGQIRLARFANPSGLDQRGNNLYASGVNSGLPVVGDPGEQGIGTVVSGAVEQSNTDLSKNLIDLITASTQYRGNARVITAAQQLLDELLNLRR